MLDSSVSKAWQICFSFPLGQEQKYSEKWKIVLKLKTYVMDHVAQGLNIDWVK